MENCVKIVTQRSIQLVEIVANHLLFNLKNSKYDEVVKLKGKKSKRKE